MVYENILKLPSILVSDIGNYEFWKYKINRKGSKLKIAFNEDGRFDIRMKRHKKLYDKHKTKKFKTLEKIYQQKVNSKELKKAHYEDRDLDEVDYDILINMHERKVGKPFSEVDGLTIDEVGEYIKISKKHLKKRLDKLEKYNLIRMEKYTLPSLEWKKKGYTKLYFIQYYKGEWIPYKVGYYRWIAWFNKYKTAFLLGSPSYEFEDLRMSINRYKRIRNSRIFSKDYKDYLRKHIILRLIELKWLN